VLRRLSIVLAAVSLVACSDVRKVESKDPALERRIAELRAKLEQRPEDVAVLIEIGEAYAAADRVFEASDAFLRATELDQQNVRARAGLAAAYLELGYVPRTVEQLRACMEVDRSYPDCLLVVGELFESDGSPPALKEARKTFRHFLALAPDHARAAYVKSKIDQLDARLGPEEPQAPAEAPEQQAASQPAHPQQPPPTEQPQQQQAADRPNAATIPGHNAAPDSEEVGELNPFGAALKRAFDAVQRNDAPGAEAAFREAVKISPNDPAALSGLAHALLAQGKNAEAIQAAESSVRADPKDSQARWTLGIVLMRTGKDVVRGIQMWEALVKDDPTYAKQMKLPEQLEEIRKYSKQQNVHPPAAPK
jgi:cytochrome c-type biogenesis protein CcmH/NrfG